MKDENPQILRPNLRVTEFYCRGSHFKISYWYSFRPLDAGSSIEVDETEIAVANKLPTKQTEPYFDIAVDLEDESNRLRIFFYGFGITPKVRALLNDEVVYGPQNFPLITRLSDRLLGGHNLALGEDAEIEALKQTATTITPDLDIDFEDNPGLLEFVFSHRNTEFKFSAWWGIEDFKNEGAYKLEADGIPLAFRIKNETEVSPGPVLCFDSELFGKLERFKVFFRGLSVNRKYSCWIDDSEVLSYNDNHKAIVLEDSRPRMTSYEYFFRAFVSLFPFVGFAIADVAMDDVPIFLQISLISFALLGLPQKIMASHGKATAHIRLTKLGSWLNLENSVRWMRKNPRRFYLISLATAILEVSLEYLYLLF